MSPYPQPYAVAATGLGIILVVTTWLYKNVRRGKLPYPPGPPPLPILGNMFDIPGDLDWVKFHQMALQYGNVVHLQAFDEHIVILDSVDAAADLLVHRSTMYSSRPVLPMLSILMDAQHWNMVLKPYDQSWREDRRMFSSQMNSNASAQFAGVQTRQARLLLKRLTNFSVNISDYIRGVVGGAVIETVYGIEVTDHTDPFLTKVEKVVNMQKEVLLPGHFWVDLLPWLRHLPSWIPGTSFHKFAKAFHNAHEDVLEEPLKDVESRMAQGTARPCMATRLLKGIPGSEAYEKHRHKIKDLVGVSYEAGVDTHLSFHRHPPLCSGSVAMILHPEVQAKAQAELDAVVGCGRLPEISDRPNLPYINAVILELLRWRPVAPMGVPHTTTDDDEYKGYFIPKGATVMTNVAAMLHNADEYPNPELFDPDRFMKMPGREPARDPRMAVFGFGKRICPGRYFAEQTIFIMISSVLAAFRVLPPCDEKGVALPFEYQVEKGIIMKPLSFDCLFEPRTHDWLALVELPLPDRDL